MVQIIPAVLATTEEAFGQDLDKIQSSDALKDGWVHIDFADNKFVPNQTITPSQLANQSIQLKKEAHLMVDNPLEWIDELARAGFARIIFHLEAKDDTLECIKAIEVKGLQTGIAINHQTPLSEIEQYIGKIEGVLMMAIEPGFQGKPFIPESLEKIRQFKARGWQVSLAVDGAVRDENAKQLVEAGVDRLIVGSFLLKGNLDENLERLWEAVKS
ncbi:ribulose-phosphate 3-epimerase [Candidatus Daviesbacteria bacterium]|nr:ribulose-phosphate 3-epimerase [Candidatus Daviesbacteria bacterium]